jgi:hypothetical protein
LDQNQHRRRSETARSDDDSDATADETFARYYACVHVDAVASSPGCRVMHEDLQQPSCSQHVDDEPADGPDWSRATRPSLSVPALVDPCCSGPAAAGGLAYTLHA